MKTTEIDPCAPEARVRAGSLDLPPPDRREEPSRAAVTTSDEASIAEQSDEFCLDLIVPPVESHEEADRQRPTPEAGSDRNRRASRIDKTARTVLAEIALARVLSRDARRALLDSSPRIVIIVVPSAQWLAPIAHVVRRSDNTFVVMRDGGEKRTAGVDRQAIDKVLANQSLLGITTDLGHLPQSLVAAADHVVTIDRPDHDLLRKVLARSCRRPVPEDVDADLLAGLDFDDIALLLRPRRPMREIVDALMRASRQRCSTLSDTVAPSLERSTAFGAARDWGLALARDVAAVRRNEIKWSDVDRGAVLFGPPGTGKTLFARSLAAACRLPIHISAISEYFAGSAGDLAAVVKAQRELFARAAASAPSLLFLDEIDAMPNRATISAHGRDWWLPVINDFLLLLDSSISARAGVIVIGATNRIEDVDEAILRPGRLERSIYLGPPDALGLEQVLRHHLDGALGGDDLTRLAARCVGATPAVAMEWVRQAKRKARVAGRQMVLADLEAAALPTALPSVENARRAAVHEAGHAVIALIIGAKVQSVSVGGIGSSCGRTIIHQIDLSMATQNELVLQLQVMLAGRAAEEKLLGSPSVGAGGTDDSDLARATRLIEAMHDRYGLGDDLVYVHTTTTGSSLLDQQTRFKIARELRDHYQRTLALIDEHREAIERVATALTDRGFLDEHEVAALASMSLDG